MFKLIYKIQNLIIKVLYKIFREPFIKASLSNCGKNVHIARGCDIKGINNISVGGGQQLVQILCYGQLKLKF